MQLSDNISEIWSSIILFKGAMTITRFQWRDFFGKSEDSTSTDHALAKTCWKITVTSLPLTRLLMVFSCFGFNTIALFSWRIFYVRSRSDASQLIQFLNHFQNTLCSESTNSILTAALELNCLYTRKIKPIEASVYVKMRQSLCHERFAAQAISSGLESAGQPASFISINETWKKGGK